MVKKYLFIISILFALFSCSKAEEDIVINSGKTTTENINSDNKIVIPESLSDAISYMSLYDVVNDKGQYYMPQCNNVPKYYWNCVDAANSANKNNPNLSTLGTGLQNHLMCQSLAGLVNRKLSKGDIQFGVWLDVSGSAYDASKLYIGKSLGSQTGIELVSKEYNLPDGIQDIKTLFQYYVLTDVKNNPESNNVATVASHVYDAIIVDVRDKDYFDNLGYKMVYDASKKSTSEAWHEFKDKCSNEALVLMPVGTAELREFAIKNNLFCININKKYGEPNSGQNLELFEEVLKWLKPGAPVLGWEQGIGEDIFVSRTSKYGKLMLASDWSYNSTLTSVNYPNRQENVLFQTINPRSINYSENKNYVSFFLTDGDNYQWMMNDDFYNQFVSTEKGKEVCMNYSFCSLALSQLAPSQFKNLVSKQPSSSTFMECFGGGYYYADTYSMYSNRKENLQIVAKRVAANMKQHRMKILCLMSENPVSEASLEAYQAFVNENSSLEGIVVIKCSQYSGSAGKVVWVKNKDGYDIPVITVKYSLWKNGLNNEGSPQKIASLLKSRDSNNSFSVIAVHAWSEFNGHKGAAIAKDCMDLLDDNYKAVSIQELVWRLRMDRKKDQTLKYLTHIK